MLKNKNIIVTGANRGIGKAIVTECAKNHANVWACIREVNDSLAKYMQMLEEEYAIWIKFVELDLTKEDSIKNAASKILSDKENIDGIVNNAGVTGANQLFLMTQMNEIKKVFDVNFFGPMFFLQRLLKKMVRQKSGSIVNMSSVAAIDGEPAQFEYVSSKAAVIGATKKLASEYGRHGIRVNAVAPGMTDTDMIQSMDDKLKELTLNRTIQQRIADTSEVAHAVIFLLSDSSSYITGQVLRVDGGGI